MFDHEESLMNRFSRVQITYPNSQARICNGIAAHVRGHIVYFTCVSDNMAGYRGVSLLAQLKAERRTPKSTTAIRIRWLFLVFLSALTLKFMNSADTMLEASDYSYRSILVR